MYQVNDKVFVRRPTCPCKSPGYEEFSGKVIKVIKNQSGERWYMLDNNKTVKESWIVQ